MKHYYNFSFFVLLFCAISGLNAQSLTKIDINTKLATGEITAIHTPFDLGILNDVFDGNFFSLARCHSSNNPMVITLAFNAPHQIGASRVLSATAAEWTLESALSLADLDNKTGSYSLLVNKDFVVANVYDSAGFNLRTATYLRLTLRRTVSDFYPHLREWEIYGMPENDKNAPDFSVCYIKRLPQIDYVWGSSNPKVEGWPAVGSDVRWRAYVRSWSPQSRSNIHYYWLWNGIKVDSGAMSFLPNGLAYADFKSNWTFDRNELTFIVDTKNAVREVVETNNKLMVYTDAISLNLYVEQSLYNYFHKYQRGVASSRKTNSFDDWAQIRHVLRWNSMLGKVKTPEAPKGVLDRIRIDSIVVVPDGTLPLAGGLPTNHPNFNDRTVDLQWGFPSTLISLYSDTTSATDSNPFYFEGSLLHELGHARYLVDNYGFDVHDVNGNVVNIKENGTFIGGTIYLPKIAYDGVYYSKQLGLMNGQHTYIDRYAAAAWNLIAGHRATLGNYNAPGNIGVYLNDLPDKNIFLIRDAAGNLLTNANVKIYQNVPPAEGGYYAKFFDSIPEFNLTSTYPGGRVVLPKNPFQTDGDIGGPEQGVILFRVETSDAVGYIFFESTHCNLAYWRGLTSSATFTLKVNMIPKLSPAADNRVSIIDQEKYEPVIYPNPANGTSVSVILPEEEGTREITVLNMTSQIKHSESISGKETLITIPVEHLENGIYTLLIKGSKGSKVEKFEILK